jgi:hypothetical protein
MKKYNFSLKMMTSKGAMAHRVIGAHPAESVMELVEYLNKNDFIVVEEFFFDMTNRVLSQVGPLILNHRIIGKVKEYTDRRPYLGDEN